MRFNNVWFYTRVLKIINIRLFSKNAQKRSGVSMQHPLEGNKRVASAATDRRITVGVCDSGGALAAASWRRTVGVLRAQTASNLEKSPKEKKESSFYNR